MSVIDYHGYVPWNMSVIDDHRYVSWNMSVIDDHGYVPWNMSVIYDHVTTEMLCLLSQSHSSLFRDLSRIAQQAPLLG